MLIGTIMTIYLLEVEFSYPNALRGAKCRCPWRTCGRADERLAPQSFRGRDNIVFWERRAKPDELFHRCPWYMLPIMSSSQWFRAKVINEKDVKVCWFQLVPLGIYLHVSAELLCWFRSTSYYHVTEMWFAKGRTCRRLSWNTTQLTNRGDRGETNIYLTSRSPFF